MPDDGLRRELVDGEVRVITPAGHPHGDLAMRIGWMLASHVEIQGLGKVNPRNRFTRIHRPGSEPVRLTGDDVLDGDDVVPGGKLVLREVFG